MTHSKDTKGGFFGPRTFETAIEVIREWDRQAGSMPLLSEQISRMKDGPQSWSTTHNWPVVMNALRSAGLLTELPATQDGVRGRVPMTEITELGREVREHFARKAIRSEVPTHS